MNTDPGDIVVGLLLIVCLYSIVFLQINIGVVKLRDSGSMGSRTCVVYDNLKSTCR